MKGKPWTPEEEKKLKELVEAKMPLKSIAAQLGLSLDEIQKKCERLGLEVVDAKAPIRTTTSIVVPKDLPSVEEAVRQKIRRLGLEVEHKKIICSTTSQKLTVELPSVEEALKTVRLCSCQ